MPYCCGYWHMKDAKCSKCNGRKVSKERVKPKVEIQDNNKLEDLPDYAIEWLQERQITPVHISKYNLMYCRNTCVDGKSYGPRLILPIMTGDRVLWWQGRDMFETTDVKYISPKTTKRYFTSIKDPQDSSIVVVEDMLSAIRLSDYCNVVSLHGNVITSTLLGTVLCDFNTVKLWLDDDAGGRSGALKFLGQYSGLVEEVKVINYKEPKLCTNAELICVLRGTNDN